MQQSSIDTTGPEARLRTEIGQGLARLDEAHGGRYLAEVARFLGVQRSTVSRWRHQRSTASSDHCDALARRWPEYFDAHDLVDLQFRSAFGAATDTSLTMGVNVIDDPALIPRAAAAALDRGYPNAADRTYRHVAMHLERNGADPMQEDPLYREEAGPDMLAYRAAVARRAAEGWRMTFVLSAGNPKRYDSLVELVEAVDGPNVEIFAYPMPIPLIVMPVVIADREVILSYDHRRWERPGAAVHFRSAAVARWANDYITDLAADAPFRLRDPSGIDMEAMTDFRAAIGVPNAGAKRSRP